MISAPKNQPLGPQFHTLGVIRTFSGLYLGLFGCPPTKKIFTLAAAGYKMALTLGFNFAAT
jgi:hypothetical protein